MAESLKARTFANVGYNSIAKVITMVFQAVGTVILTRTLTAGDYGIVGFAGIFTSFLGQFSDLGIGSALIHRREVDEKSLYTAFTLKFFLGIGICLIAYVAAPIAITFFDNPAVVDVIRIMSLSFVINTFMFLPNVLFTKELNFKKISFYNTVTIFVQTCIAVVLALKGLKFWSIVLANITSVIFMAALVNVLKPMKPRFMFNMDIARQLVNYGGNIFLTGFLVFLIFNIDNFMIGSILGSTQLGYYALAFNWGTMICTLISSTILTVMFPTLSKMDGDKGRIRSAYLRSLEYLGFGGLLVTLTLFVVSEDFLIHVLGNGTDKWIPALITLRILCIYGSIRILIEPVGSVIMALGKTEQLRKANFLVAAIELLLLYPVIKSAGIEGTAVLVTIAYLAQFAVYYPFIKKELNISFFDLFVVVRAPIVGVCMTTAFILLFGRNWESSLSVMLLKILCCVGSYVLIHGIITKWKLLKEACDILSAPNPKKA